MLPSFQGRRSLREEIVQTLRGAVISGELRPGVVYSAPSLAAQFGVSPTPVREAMVDLAKDGLIEPLRNKGFRVVELSDKELDDLADLRELIEVPVIRRLAEAGVDPAEIDRLRPLATGIERAAADRDLTAHAAIDLEFHLALLALDGNERVVETVRSLRLRSRIYGARQLAENDALVPSAREHSELLDLITSGDAPAAEALMRRHIGHVRGIWAARREDPSAC
ncbi:GntR family transcriptional regulator [Streptomyces pathocidini]|uniref:GntR family transcriptional regulator n=1 Tax=Streptomyces pathocidini TaxID=1650571 RepID=UPI0033E8E2BE